MWPWLLLLAIIIFIMYMWVSRKDFTAAAAPGCNACAKKNVSAVE